MKTLRGALVGFGFIAERGHAPAYASTEAPLEIAAVVEPCASRLSAVARALPRAKVYSSFDALLAQEPLDFVDICAPPSEHAPMVFEALERGLHVLCEKPMATSAVAARAMAEAALRAGRVLYPAHSYRHAPVVRAVREVLSRGVIGPVRMVTMDTFRTGHARGVDEWYPDWRRDPRHSGGGILFDHGPHTAYLAFEWFGAYPSAVRAWARSAAGDKVEDDATFQARFPGGMLRAQLSWNASLRRVVYTLHGERGAVRVEDDEVEVVVRSHDGQPTSDRHRHPSHWGDAGHGAWFEGVIHGFADAIERRDFVGRDTEDAVRAMQVICGALASARMGGAEVALDGRATLEDVA
ncbi:MAG TPA: Gfo/Idh/MocA family oxidoreductase [Polyangiaceae bacterium]|jgi:predicted dehydrogenase